MATYKVIGNHAVNGVAPGGKVDLDDEVNARRLVRGGHLEPVKAEPEPEDTPVSGIKKGRK